MESKQHRNLMIKWFLAAAFLTIFLMIPGYYFYSFCMFGLMMFYGLVLLSNKAQSTKFGPNRRTPWFLLVLAMAVMRVGPTREFEQPKYPEIKPVKSWKDVPVTIDDLQVGMTQDQVRELKGEPTSKDLSHFLMPLKMGAPETARVLERLLESKPDLIDRQKLVLAKDTYSKATPPGEELRESALDKMRDGLLDERIPKVIMTELSLKEDNYQSLLKLDDSVKPGPNLILFLSRDPNSKTTGLLLSDDARRQWVYDTEELSVTFDTASPATVEMVSGQTFRLGTRTLAQTGDPLIKIYHPGLPPTPEKQKFLKNVGHDLPVYKKDLFGNEVFLEVEGETIRSFRLGW